MKPNFCPNCGKDTASSDIFCANCGHRLGANYHKMTKTTDPDEPVKLEPKKDIAPTIEANATNVAAKRLKFWRLFLIWYAWSVGISTLLFWIIFVLNNTEQESVIGLLIISVFLGALLGFLIAPIGAIIHKHFYLKKHPELIKALDAETSTSDLNGISGWLAFFVVGLSLSTVVNVVVLLIFLAAAGQYMEEGSGVYIWYQILSTAALLGLVVWSLVLILKRKQRAILIVTLLLSFSALVATVDGVIDADIQSQTVGTTSETSSTSASAGAGRAIIAALVWIPYFYRSKRVKATLIKP